MPETRPQTSFPDVADVVSVRTHGKLPVIVGGHAVNVWALAYSSRMGPRLSPYGPFTSKDLDLWGPKEILDSLSQKYGVEVTLSPPRSPGLGFVVIPKGNVQLKVELLSGVNGLRPAEIENTTFDLVIQGTNVRVLDAISCLKAKIANAADIDQTNRQDVKHVQIMKICAHEFIKDLVSLGDQGRVSPRAVVNRLEDVRETVTSPKAELVTTNGASLLPRLCRLRPSDKARWKRCGTSPASDWNRPKDHAPRSTLRPGKNPAARRCHSKGHRIKPWHQGGVTLNQALAASGVTSSR